MLAIESSIWIIGAQNCCTGWIVTQLETRKVKIL